MTDVPEISLLVTWAKNLIAVEHHSLFISTVLILSPLLGSITRLTSVQVLLSSSGLKYCPS